MNKFISFLLLFMICFLVQDGYAHHSFAAEFDYDLIGTVEGEVIEVLYGNPHARYFIELTNNEGKREIWDIQTMSVSALTRFGWKKDTIKVGDRVIMKGNLGRGNTRKLWIREVIKADGTVITPAPGGAGHE